MGRPGAAGEGEQTDSGNEGRKREQKEVQLGLRDFFFSLLLMAVLVTILNVTPSG